VREKGSDAVRTNFAAHMYSEPFARLAATRAWSSRCRQLFGEKLYMHQFKINGKMAFEGDVWQWHQDYGTWKNDDLMPTERAMNVAIFLDDVNEFNGPLMFIPGSHKKGVVDARHDLTTTSYPLWTVDNDADHAAGRARRRQARRHRQRPKGPAGSMLLFHSCLVHASHQQPEPVEPRQRLPEPVRREQPHPALQAAGATSPTATSRPSPACPTTACASPPGRPAVEERHAGSALQPMLGRLIADAKTTRP
jgi:ectoine hydroxylase-related dioxygenase (phytanoyl-CoA dioxygenase family)